MSTKMEVIIGTYEEFVLGYVLEGQKMKQTFADKSHSGAVKSVSVHSHWIATGGTDDRMFIYDMRSRKQSQIILSHTGTINTLDFTPDGTHLLSGSDDGHMICTRLNTWSTEGNWDKAHGGLPVTHISCHPSGKLALSLGGDLVLRTWNLVKGRVAYKTNLKSKGTLGRSPDCLSWSPTGDYFTIGGQRIVEFWSIQIADVVKTQKTSSKPVSLCWVSDTTCLVGLEDGKVLWITLESETETIIIDAHTTRVKAMAFLKGILVTVSSSGEMKMWQVDKTRRKVKELSVVQIGCRPTCLGLLDLDQFGNNYMLTKSIEFSTLTQTKQILTKKTNKDHSCSVVTIEYENNDEIISGAKMGRDKIKNINIESNINDSSEGNSDFSENEVEKNDTPQKTSVSMVKRKNQFTNSKRTKLIKSNKKNNI